MARQRLARREIGENTQTAQTSIVPRCSQRWSLSNQLDLWKFSVHHGNAAVNAGIIYDDDGNMELMTACLKQR